MHELKKTTRRSAVRHQAGQKERLAAVSGTTPCFMFMQGAFVAANTISGGVIWSPSWRRAWRKPASLPCQLAQAASLACLVSNLST